MGNIDMGILRIPIKTGQTHFRASLETVAFANGRRDPITNRPLGLHSQLADMNGITIPALDEIADVESVDAQVSANRWVVQCPDCGGAEYVWFETPIYICLSCFNTYVGGLWRRVSLPNVRTRALVEQVLQARPIPLTRHWSPGTTISQLRNENIARGDRIKLEEND